MFRTSDIIMLGVIVASAAFTYQTKHEAENRLSDIRKIEAQIRFEEDTIDVLKADWSKPSEVKTQFGTASILRHGRAVFNVAGNKYRIVVWINYAYRVVYIRFIGTHRQYDDIDAQTI